MQYQTTLWWLPERRSALPRKRKLARLGATFLGHLRLALFYPPRTYIEICRPLKRPEPVVQPLKNDTSDANIGLPTFHAKILIRHSGSRLEVSGRDAVHQERICIHIPILSARLQSHPQRDSHNRSGEGSPCLVSRWPQVLFGLPEDTHRMVC